MGGPMMGYTLHSDLVPIVKTSNCILVPSDKEMPFPGDEHPCIRCGACADACPAGLLPQQLYWHAKAKEYDKAQALNLFDCIECGACAFVCPSNIPLVHYYRGAKADIRIQQDEAIKAAKAKERFEARNARLEKEKLEREEKARQSAAARAKRQEQAVQTKDKPVVPAANDRVAAALARANRRFHRQIHLASHNRYLVQQLDLVHRSMALMATTSLAAQGRGEIAQEEHKAIVSAIEAGDQDAAEKALQDHISVAFMTRLKQDADQRERNG